VRLQASYKKGAGCHITKNMAKPKNMANTGKVSEEDNRFDKNNVEV
jgi:hypothetical protein